MKNIKGQQIKYKPVGNFAWRTGEILAMSFGKARIRILEPMEKGGIIEISHYMFPQFAEVIEQNGAQTEIFVPNNVVEISQ